MISIDFIGETVRQDRRGDASRFGFVGIQLAARRTLSSTKGGQSLTLPLPLLPNDAMRIRGFTSSLQPLGRPAQCDKNSTETQNPKEHDFIFCRGQYLEQPDINPIESVCQLIFS
jgi:hypothetical protein